MNTLILQNICKSYGHREIVCDVSCTLSSGSISAVVGPNGSGKSTLVKIMSGLLRPDSGSIQFSIGNTVIDRVDIPFHSGCVAPYLKLYEEFTPAEHLRLHSQLHGRDCGDERITTLLTQVGLRDRMTSSIRTFSSGMKQRVALALAISLDPALLVLDEPSTTLDDSGRALLATVVSEASNRGAIVVIATNDPREQELCSNTITLA